MVDPDNPNADRAGIDAQGRVRLRCASGDQPWKLVRESDFDAAKKSMVPRAMAADEELNVTNLDALKSALEDLKIVDVERKPAAVPADLRVRKIDNETRATLMERGFFVLSDPQDPQRSAGNPLEFRRHHPATGRRRPLHSPLRHDDRRVRRAAEKAKKKGSANPRRKTRRKTIPRPAWTATCS